MQSTGATRSHCQLKRGHHDLRHRCAQHRQTSKFEPPRFIVRAQSKKESLTYEGCDFAGRGVQVEGAEDDDVGSRRVRECDVTQLDVAPDGLSGYLALGVAWVDLAAPVDDAENARDGLAALGCARALWLKRCYFGSFRLGHTLKQR